MTHIIVMCIITIMAVVAAGPALWPPRQEVTFNLLDRIVALDVGDVLEASGVGLMIVTKRRGWVITAVRGRWYERAWWRFIPPGAGWPRVGGMG